MCPNIPLSPASMRPCTSGLRFFTAACDSPRPTPRHSPARHRPPTSPPCDWPAATPCWSTVMPGPRIPKLLNSRLQNRLSWPFDVLRFLETHCQRLFFAENKCLDSSRAIVEVRDLFPLARERACDCRIPHHTKGVAAAGHRDDSLCLEPDSRVRLAGHSQ